MVDLTREMADLWAALGRPSPLSGRIVMIVAAHSGEGASTVSREFARCAAAYARKPVWLVDADISHQSQLDAISEDRHRFGPPGPLASAAPDGQVFFSVRPPTKDAQGKLVQDGAYLICRPFLDRKLWVTRFRDQFLKRGQTVRLRDDNGYWDAMRQHAETTIVDVPAADRSATALALAPYMDAIVMVVAEEFGTVESRLTLRNDLEEAGGRLAGMVYNRARQIRNRPLKRLVP
ncbi:MAG: transcriptional regulator [Asticcacaulis sp.]